MNLWKQGKIWSLTLSLLLLASCSSGESGVSETPATDSSVSQGASGDTENKAEDNQEENQEEEVLTDRGDVEVSLVMLTGPTGMGAASLIGDNLEDKTRNPYEVTMLPANDQAVAMLTSGEADIAALSTSVAATLHNKADNITVLGVNTLGVLYVLAKGEESTLETMGDLSDKTIYTTGQGANPEYILNKLLVEAGVDPESQVDIQWMTADEVSATLITEGGIAMLPVPATTALMMKDDAVEEVIDVGAEWERTVSTGLPMGCVVVRNEFLEEHPDAVDRFMEDYRESIATMADESNHADVASLVVDAGISPSEPIALEALPKASLVLVEGNEMKTMLESYYRVMFDANPDSIGGGLPYDDFYFGAS